MRSRILSKSSSHPQWPAQHLWGGWKVNGGSPAGRKKCVGRILGELSDWRKRKSKSCRIRGTLETGPGLRAAGAAFLSIHFCLCLGKIHSPRVLNLQTSCQSMWHNSQGATSSPPAPVKTILRKTPVGPQLRSHLWPITLEHSHYPSLECGLSLGAGKWATKKKPSVGLRRGCGGMPGSQKQWLPHT